MAHLYDCDGPDELLYRFAVDQYHEFDAVDRGDADIMNDNPLWDDLSSGEKQILSLLNTPSSKQLATAMDRYADRWMEFKEEYNWAVVYSDELGEILPDKGVYLYGSEPTITQGGYGKIKFREFLEEHQDAVLTASSPRELDQKLDDPTSDKLAEKNGVDVWYSGVLQALDIGTPPIRERIGDRPPENDPELCDRAAAAMNVLDRTVETVFGTTAAEDHNHGLPRYGS